MRTLKIPGASCSNMLATHIGTPIVAVKTTRGYAGNYSVAKSTSYTVWLCSFSYSHVTAAAVALVEITTVLQFQPQL